jgi:xanthine dehydrogenase/oxidase
MAALLGQPWEESSLQAALAALRQDVNVAPTAPGGRGEYRNSLAASFLYKFYIHVSCMGLASHIGVGQVMRWVGAE